MFNKAYFRIILILFWSGTIFLLLNVPITETLNSILVQPVFSKIESNLFTNVLLVIACVILLVWFWIVGDLEYQVGLTELLLLFFLIQRCNPYWKFTSTVFNENICLWDIFIASIVIPRLKPLFHWKENDGNTKPKNLGGFIEERPVLRKEEDSFQRNVVAKEIADRIAYTNTSKSFAIGVLGDYGSGKTSFINLIRLNLPNAIEMIYFNPWSAENAPDIQKDFFDILSNYISKSDPKLSHLVLSYSRKLRKIDNRIESFSQKVYFLDNLLYKNSYGDDYNKINALLRKSNRKIVVAIDDLDRLNSTEIIEVLKLIRNTASFSNVMFIVAYEKTYVEEAIKELNSRATSSYLDKIIQLEIPLPKRESYDLLDLLTREIAKVLASADLTVLKNRVIQNGFEHSFNTNYKTVFRHSRDVIKFVNSFMIPYSLLGEEVLFDDLFVLELLKFRYPIVYDQLYERREEFLKKSASRSSFQETYHLMTVQLDGNETPSLVSSLAGQYSNEDKSLISGLLYRLFNKYRDDKNNRNSIIYPMFFERYFRYRIANEISEKDFQAAFKEGLVGLKNYIDDCSGRGLLGQILNRLFQQEIKGRVGFEIIIGALFYLGPKCVREKGNVSFDYRSLVDMIWNYDQKITNKFYRGSHSAYRAFLIDLFKSALDPYIFHNQLIYQIKKEGTDICVQKEELTSLQVEYFKKYIDQFGLTRDGLWLMWGIREYYTSPGPKTGTEYKHWRFEPVILPSLRDFLRKKDPFYFLVDSINTNLGEDGLAAIHPQILQIFEHENDLRKLVETSVFLTEDVRREYLDFFDHCKEERFEKFVVYEFKTKLRLGRQTEA